MSPELKNFCVIFTEGETDSLFYKRVIDYYSKKFGKPKIPYLIKNLRGVGQYRKKVCAYFKNDIYAKYPNFNHFVFLTYDTDVFEYAAKPPINWKSSRR
ncbi:MAG: hypothetical protein V1773_10785 [bacterium]